MSRHSTPETRSYARDKAEIIGQAETIVRGEIKGWATRVASHRATPAVAVAAFFGFILLAHWVVGLVNL